MLFEVASLDVVLVEVAGVDVLVEVASVGVVLVEVVLVEVG